jgi:hypothetical protein
MEFAAVVGLVQQHQQVKLQRATVAEQQYTNFLMEQQVAMQNQQELQRQKEKLIDLWCRELEHQGMSPLKAYGQAMSELEIQQLVRESSYILESYSAQLEMGHEKVVVPALSEKDFPVIIFSVFGALSMLFGFAATQYWAIPLGAGLFYLAYYFNQQKKLLDQEALIFNYQKNLTKQTQAQLQPYLEAFEALPASKLFDDKPLRKMLRDFLSVDVDAYSEESSE